MSSWGAYVLVTRVLINTMNMSVASVKQIILCLCCNYVTSPHLSVRSNSKWLLVLLESKGTHTYTHTHTYTCMHTHAYTHTHACTRTHTHIHTCTHTCTQTWAHTRVSFGFLVYSRNWTFSPFALQLSLLLALLPILLSYYKQLLCLTPLCTQCHSG